MEKGMAKRLIVGCGYLGQRVARLWAAFSDEVFAVTRSEERAAEFAASGWRPIVADVCDSSSLSNLPTVDSVLFAVGYGRSNAQSIHDVYVGGLKNVLDRVRLNSGARFVYISSTG